MTATLTPHQKTVLAYLKANPNANTDDLAAHFHTTRAGVYNTLKRIRGFGISYEKANFKRQRSTITIDKVLREIKSNPGQSCKGLARKVGVSPAQVQRHVTALKKKGFIIVNGYTITGQVGNDGAVRPTAP